MEKFNVGKVPKSLRSEIMDAEIIIMDAKIIEGLKLEKEARALAREKGKGKLERLSKARQKLKGAINCFGEGGYKAGVLRCKGTQNVWSAQIQWLKTQGKSGEQELKMRRELIERLNSGGKLLEDSLKEKWVPEDTNRDNTRELLDDIKVLSQKWSGVLARHERKWDKVIRHFGRAERLPGDPHGKAWYRGARKEAEMWKKIDNLKNIESMGKSVFNELAEGFRSSYREYRESKDEKNANYMNACAMLCEFIANPGYEEFNRIKSFEKKTGKPLQDYINISARGEEKKLLIRRFEPIFKYFEEKIYPYRLLEEEVIQPAQQLEAKLKKIRKKLLKSNRVYRSLNRESLSLEKSVSIFERIFGIKPPEEIKWMVDINWKHKHRVRTPAEERELINEVLSHKDFIPRLPDASRRYWEEVVKGIIKHQDKLSSLRLDSK